MGSGKPFDPNLAQKLGVQPQTQIMIGLDQGDTAATLNRTTIVKCAQAIYVEMMRRPVKNEDGSLADPGEAQLFNMEQAALQAVSLFDRVQVTIDEWNEAKDAAAKAATDAVEAEKPSGLELVK